MCVRYPSSARSSWKSASVALHAAFCSPRSAAQAAPSSGSARMAAAWSLRKRARKACTSSYSAREPICTAKKPSASDRPDPSPIASMRSCKSAAGGLSDFMYSTAIAYEACSFPLRMCSRKFAPSSSVPAPPSANGELIWLSLLRFFDPSPSSSPSKAFLGPASKGENSGSSPTRVARKKGASGGASTGTSGLFRSWISSRELSVFQRAAGTPERVVKPSANCAGRASARSLSRTASSSAARCAAAASE
mmetsp:Transcript_13939/g.35460  ORF Transcript_13939/g.35460 Transcript_13939/m.35460 type:complete len:249 (-) Transcript_13939:1241-1987(-)